MANAQKIKKGDFVHLETRFGGKGIDGILQKGEYHKETKTYIIKIQKENGCPHMFLGRKEHFSLEKIDVI